MIETATFSMFHRARPRPAPQALPEAERLDGRVLGEPGALNEELLPGRLVQQIRARRRAARERMLEPEAWAEAEHAEPPEAHDEPPAPLTPAVAVAPPEVPGSHPAPSVGPAGPYAERPVLPAERAEPAPESFAAAHEMVETGPRLFEKTPEVIEEISEVIDAAPEASEPAAPYAEPAIHHPEPLEPAPEPPVSDAEPLAAGPEPIETPGKPELPHPELLGVPAEALDDAAEASAAHEPSPEHGEPHTPAAGRDAFLAEPLVLEDERPVEPAVLEPAHPEAPAAAQLADEDIDPAPAWGASPVLRHDYRSDPLRLEYQMLGLANPVVCTVIATIGDAEPIRLSIGRTGIYRPDGFRAAPWSGFAYDLSADGRTGLVVGTRVLTARGEVPVEQLIPGDSALALRGPALLPILWIGRSIADEPPIQIAAGAFGPDRPRKSLCVGADHAIFMQTFPVPARDLVNGGTIRSLDVDVAELFHIDVGSAEVLLAEGVPLASGHR